MEVEEWAKMGKFWVQNFHRNLGQQILKIFKYKKDKRREVNKLKTLKKFKTFMMEPLAKISNGSWPLPIFAKKSFNVDV